MKTIRLIVSVEKYTHKDSMWLDDGFRMYFSIIFFKKIFLLENYLKISLWLALFIIKRCPKVGLIFCCCFFLFVLIIFSIIFVFNFSTSPYIIMEKSTTQNYCNLLIGRWSEKKEEKKSNACSSIFWWSKRKVTKIYLVFFQALFSYSWIEKLSNG